MAKYTEVFKLHAVKLLKELNEKEIVIVNSVEIKNVRALILELGCSSYSLYGWDKIYNPKEFDGEVKDLEPIDIDIDDFDLFDVERLDKTTGEKYNMDIKKMKRDAIKEFAINQRNMSSLAQALQISNYSSMKLAHMRLAIGNELIKLSGLVDMNKASKKLKQNGDKL